MSAVIACGVAVLAVTMFPSMWLAILIALLLFAVLDLTGGVK